MTAEKFILNPKHLYVEEQPHAARLLHDNSIKHNAQLSYLHPLRPQLSPQTSETTAKKETVTENAEPQQEQLELLTDDGEVTVERDKDEVSEEKTIDRPKIIYRLFDRPTITGFRRKKVY